MGLIPPLELEGLVTSASTNIRPTKIFIKIPEELKWETEDQ